MQRLASSAKRRIAKAFELVAQAQGLLVFEVNKASRVTRMKEILQLKDKFTFSVLALIAILGLGSITFLSYVALEKNSCIEININNMSLKVGICREN